MISIITSLYKSETHLPSFIRRLKKMDRYLNTNGIEHQFIILPNNQNMIESNLLAQLDKIAIVIPRKLETIYATWNCGISNAKYENICFWNVDDIRFGRAIVSGLNDLNNGADIVYFPFIYFRYLKIHKIKLLAKVRLFVPPIFNKERFMKEMHCGPFFMTKRNSLNKVGLFNEQFTVAGDFEWCVRATIKGLTFKRNNNIAGIFTSDGTTLSGSHSTKHSNENTEIYKLSQS